jgi:integrase
VRAVVLVPEVARLLKAHRMASLYKAPTDFVFAGPGGKGKDHRSTARTVQRIVEKAGLSNDVTYHTLRHAFASMLITSLGMDVESVSRQLGHTTSSITLSTYSHEFDAARNVDKLRDALSGAFKRISAASS